MSKWTGNSDGPGPGPGSGEAGSADDSAGREARTSGELLATRGSSAGLRSAQPRLAEDRLATRGSSPGLSDLLATRASGGENAPAAPLGDPLATRVSSGLGASSSSGSGDDLLSTRTPGAAVGDSLATRASSLGVDAAPPWSKGPGGAPKGAGSAGALVPEERLQISRYLVLSRLGAGGMGVVYRAYDPDLDRRVALKLLHGHSTADARTRLLREAQAMAKLSHPNVVPVFDVGVVGDEVFIAMDFIDGETLGAWIAGGPRPWREVLDVFRQAGGGLAAAHAVGLVHRDFKPDNVLLARDPATGRLRAQVADFGLARLGDDDVDVAGPRSTGASPRVSASALLTELTHVGAVLGTPAYMSPEQHAGAPVDARTDQFSFCVAFYEALYGRRPYDGATLEALGRAARSSEREPPPPGVGVPSWLHQIVLRGMRPAPGDRFAGMERLLAALDSGEQRASRRWLALGAVVAAGGVAGAFALHEPAPALCAGAPARVAAIWGDEQRSEAAAAFTATKLPYAADAWASAGARVDAWAEAWSEAATEACAATQLRGELSPAIMDLRVACLDRRLQHLQALADLFAGADEDVVRRAVDAAASLPGLEPCSDLVALQADVAPPPPALADAVAAARAEIAAARALERGGKDGEALASLDARRAQIEALDYLPLKAEMLFATSRAQSDQGADEEALKSARDGLWAAISAGDDPLTRDVLGQLIWVSGYKLGRADEARSWIDHAGAMVRRDGDPPRGRAKLLSDVGHVEMAAARYVEAEAAFRQCIELYEESGADDLTLLNPLNALSMARLRAGRYDEALPPLERALAIATAARGPNHPDLANLLNSLALIHERHGRYSEAIDALRRTLAIIEATGGPEHPNAGIIRQNLGGLLLYSDRVTEAEAELRSAVRILEAALGDSHPAIAGAHSFLGDVLRERGDLVAAKAEYQRAYDIRVAALGDDHLDVALPLLGLGQVAIAEGRLADAVRDLERAERLMTSTASDPVDLGLVRLNLARALVDSDAARARRVARLALGELEGAGATAERHRLAAETWLREHPGDDGAPPEDD